MTKLIIPQALKPGDQVAIISTARSIDPEKLHDAIQLLEKWGLICKEGRNLRRVFNQFAGTIEERASDLQWAITEENIKGIICFRGGYGTVQIIDKVNLPQGNFFSNDKCLQEIKTSSLSPTGIMTSDLPQLQLWLKQLSPNAKQQYFLNKIDPYLPIFKSISIYLNTLRESVKNEAVESTDNGLISYQLDPSFRHDLVQLQIPQNLNLYPNLTSNKYTVNIQFSSFKKNTNNVKKIKFKMGVSEQ